MAKYLTIKLRLNHYTEILLRQVMEHTEISNSLNNALCNKDPKTFGKCGKINL